MLNLNKKSAGVAFASALAMVFVTTACSKSSTSGSNLKPSQKPSANNLSNKQSGTTTPKNPPSIAKQTTPPAVANPAQPPAGEPLGMPQPDAAPTDVEGIWQTACVKLQGSDMVYDSSSHVNYNSYNEILWFSGDSIIYSYNLFTDQNCTVDSNSIYEITSASFDVGPAPQFPSDELMHYVFSDGTDAYDLYQVGSSSLTFYDANGNTLDSFSKVQ